MRGSGSVGRVVVSGCALLIAAYALGGCVEGPSQGAGFAPETSAQAIRNGTREPQVVPLEEGQQLAIGWLYWGNRASDNFCTGTLIAPNLVATAAHCTSGNRARDIGFGVGLLPEDPAGTFRVLAKYEHPSVDAALMVLDGDATAEVEGLVPIAANRAPIPSERIGTMVEAAGYGETYDRTREGRYFAAVELERIQTDEIIVNGNGQQGICFGDSGGPVMMVDDAGEIVVLAVESWGDESCVGRDHLTRLDTIAGWMDAIANGETPEDPCAGLDYYGRCTDDNVAEWCQNGRLIRRDCSALGTTCGFANEDVGYICTCGDLDYFGRCNGDVVEYCDDGRFAQRDCVERGLRCGLADEQTGYWCTDKPGPDPEPTCVASCEGEVAIRCVDDVAEAEDCGAAGGECQVGAQGPYCYTPIDGNNGAANNGGTGNNGAAGNNSGDTDDPDDVRDSNNSVGAVDDEDEGGAGPNVARSGASDGCQAAPGQLTPGALPLAGLLALLLVAAPLRRR